MIGTIKKTSRSKDIIGIRLANIDGDKAECKDVGIQSVIKVLSNGAVVRNLEIVNGEVRGTEGSIDRYGSLCSSGSSNQRQPLVVLARIGDKGYRYINIEGKIGNVRSSDLIKYANTVGLANAKVVNKDGKEFIAGLNFNIPVIEQTSTQENSNNKGETDYKQKQIKDTSAGKEGYIKELLIDKINKTGNIDNDVISTFELGANAVLNEFTEIGGMGGVRGPYINRDKKACCKCGNVEDIVYRHSGTEVCGYCISELVDSNRCKDVRNTGSGLRTAVYNYLKSVNEKVEYDCNTKLDIVIRAVIVYNSIQEFIQSEKQYYSIYKKCALVLVQKKVGIPQFLANALSNMLAHKCEAFRLWKCYTDVNRDNFDRLVKSSGIAGEILNNMASNTTWIMSGKSDIHVTEVAFKIRYIVGLVGAQEGIRKYISMEEISDMLNNIDDGKLSRNDRKIYNEVSSICHADTGNIFIPDSEEDCILGSKRVADVQSVYNEIMELSKHIKNWKPSSDSINIQDKEAIDNINEEYSKEYGDRFMLENYDKIHRSVLGIQ